MNPTELIRQIEQRGGLVALTLDGEALCVRVPREEAERLTAQLRAMKPDVIALMRQRTMVHLDLPCTCDEQPYQHFRHLDGAGPGGRYTLELRRRKQAHEQRRVHGTRGKTDHKPVKKEVKNGDK